MLQELYIENFVIVKKVSIKFDPSFNVITGETGAGKSILVNALKLLLGDRFQKSYIGNYGDKSIVEGKFIIDSIEKINRFKERGYELEDGVLIITREAGKSNSINNRINGRNVTLSFLKQVMEDLIDIHSQNENQTLLNKSNYIKILDAFSPEGNRDILNQLKDKLSVLKSLKEDRNSLNLSPEEVDREKDILRFQINELDSIDLENISEENLENEYKVLSNINSIKKSIGEISLNFRNDEFNQFEILGSLNEVMNEVASLKELDLELKGLFDRIESCYYELEDIYFEINNYGDHLYYDEEKLEELNNRISLLTNLKRKYGSQIDDLINFRYEAKMRLKTLEEIEKNIHDINLKISKTYMECEKLCDTLTKRRKSQARKLESNILENIKSLNMSNAKFSIDFQISDTISNNGRDIVEFNISTNVGQSLKPLSKVASGGELSRIMLALKTSLASIDNVDTLIFDEVDTGISGRTAILVGEKLQKISEARQIITISHLAQIASLASFHILIEKNEGEQNTISNIRPIDGEERVLEISRLIGGVDITKNTIAQAEDMIIQGKLQLKKKGICNE